MSAVRSLCSLLVVIQLGCGSPPPQPMPSAPVPTAIGIISRLIGEGKLDVAEQQTLKLLEVEPKNPQLLVLGGEIAGRQNRWKIAADRYLAAGKLVPGKNGIPIYHRAAMAAAQSGQYFLSVDQLSQVLKLSPDDPTAHREIAGVLCMIGFEWEAMENLHWLVRNHQGPPGDLMGTLIVLADRSRSHGDINWIDAGLKYHPSDLRPLVGKARIASMDSKWSEVEDYCEQVLARHPDCLEAWVLLGRALWESGKQERLKQWVASPLANAERHPDYWLAIGKRAAAMGDLSAAAIALGKALSLDPTLREAARELAPILMDLGEVETAEKIAAYAELLDAIVSRVDYFVGWKNQSQTGAVDIAELMLKAGRAWEANRWASLATTVSSDPSPRTAQIVRASRQPQLISTPIIAAEQHPARLLTSLSKSQGTEASTKSPSSPIESKSDQTGNPSSEKDQSRGTVQFANEATERGLDFRYVNGDDPQKPGIWIHQSNGGGVAAFDFDLNSFPDLCLMQAGGKPLEDSGSLPTRLFRNLGGKFHDISGLFMGRDHGYGQGAAAADYNDDGFPDLMLAHIGSNRLLRNNGDGTLSDVTHQAGLQGSRWTTSLALADFDGDLVCDILEVNYCAGTEPFTVACYKEDGKLIMACSPNAFQAEPDQFWKGNGDGTFRNETERMLHTDYPGRGLGVVATEFDGKPGLEIFVANDMTANHFWVPRSTDAGTVFQEQAAVRGLATDSRGNPQACMGIALGDPDQDGDVDLVVTNFWNQPNNFYQQSGAGRFADRTFASGLAEPSRLMLGFGCQFADFDGNGTTELIVANGHIQDEAADRENAMFSQVFSYSNGWRELPKDSLGGYFLQRHVGRSVALLDVQQDGWPDILVTHVVAPTALLMNVSVHTRQSLGLELVARSTCRDAVGTRVEGVIAGRREVRWVVAGDGFLSSNEKKLWFSIPSGESVDLEITWPQGTKQQLRVAAGSYLVVEGKDPVPRVFTD